MWPSSAGLSSIAPGEGALYRDSPYPRRSHPAILTAVPYGTWDNRTAGPMKVWLRAV